MTEGYITCGPGTDTAFPPPWIHGSDYVLVSSLWSTKQEKKWSKVLRLLLSTRSSLESLCNSCECCPAHLNISYPYSSPRMPMTLQTQSPRNVHRSNSIDNESASEWAKFSLEFMESSNWLLTVNCSPSPRPLIDPSVMWCRLDVTGLAVLVREKQHTMSVLD